MIEQQSNFSLHLVRYGLPVIIMVFYLTSIVHFNYTPESTFLSLRSAQVMTGSTIRGELPTDMSTSPLWCFLVVVAAHSGVNMLLAAKVLSLLFASVSILCFHLVVNEIVQDRLVAFLATIPFAAQGWLIQMAPSGSPFLFGLALSLAGMFFMLRNEYLISACLISLATLAFWQAIGLMTLLFFDVYLNSIDFRRGVKIGIGTLLIFLGTLGPWFAFAAWRGMHFLPVIPSSEAFMEMMPLDYALPLLLLCIISIGVVFLWRSGVDGLATLRALAPLLGAVIWFSVASRASNVNAIFFGLPFVMILAFFVTRVLVLRRAQRWAYPGMLTLAGLLLLFFQVRYHFHAKENTDEAISRSEELSVIGNWLHSNVNANDVIAAEEPASLSYYADRPVKSLRIDGVQEAIYVVASNAPGQFFEKIYDPTPSISTGVGTLLSCYAVWKRR